MELKLNASLISTGRSNGQSYTEQEKRLATDIAQTVLTATGHKTFEVEDNQEVLDALQAVVDEKGEAALDVPSLCRACYRAIEKERLADPAMATAFPKEKEGERVPRDFTSVNLLFRKALIDKCGIDKATVDQIFPAYQPGKKKKTA